MMIDILDLSLVGAQYALNCADAGFDARADINGDCTISILDITVLGGNFGLVGPVAWP